MAIKYKYPEDKPHLQALAATVVFTSLDESRVAALLFDTISLGAAPAVVGAYGITQAR